MREPRIRLIGELPAWVSVRGRRYLVKLSISDEEVHPSSLGAHQDGKLGHWLLSHSLPSDRASALAELREGIPVQLGAADVVLEIQRQLVRDRIFEVCRDPAEGG